MTKNNTFTGISQNGIELIKRFEGFRASSYLCDAGKPTIGYGHVIQTHESFRYLDEKEATLLLLQDLKTYEAPVIALASNNPINQNQGDALVSLCYNIGVKSILRSSVFRNIHAGNYVAAADAFLLWNKVNCDVNKGLVKRREQERALFLTA